MNVFKQSVLSLFALALMIGSSARALAADADGDKFKAYEERIKALEQHVRELEGKLTDGAAHNLAENKRPKAGQFTRDRFEEMMLNNKHYFFDADEFEDIIDYYFDKNNTKKSMA